MATTLTTTFRYSPGDRVKCKITGAIGVVDDCAINRFGMQAYFVSYPDERAKVVERWVGANQIVEPESSEPAT